MKSLSIFFSILLVILSAGNTESQTYGIAKIPAPVLNTPDFKGVFGGESGKEVRTDEFGFIAELEFIALPGTAFEIIESYPEDNHYIYEVRTNDYPYPEISLFADSRFIDITDIPPFDRKLRPIFVEEIQENLINLIGVPYLWGGNYSAGIPEMLEFYKPKGEIDKKTRNKWILKGVDCSGLLYEATEGFTPRNTSGLENFGSVVDIKNKNSDDIIGNLQPLDLILWKGHVIIVLDEEKVIESLPERGVITTKIYDRFREILSEFRPANFLNSKDEFIIRRWTGN